MVTFHCQCDACMRFLLWGNSNGTRSELTFFYHLLSNLKHSGFSISSVTEPEHRRRSFLGDKGIESAWSSQVKIDKMVHGGSYEELGSQVSKASASCDLARFEGKKVGLCSYKPERESQSEARNLVHEAHSSIQGSLRYSRTEMKETRNLFLWLHLLLGNHDSGMPQFTSLGPRVSATRILARLILTKSSTAWQALFWGLWGSNVFVLSQLHGTRWHYIFSPLCPKSHAAGGGRATKSFDSWSAHSQTCAT